MYSTAHVIIMPVMFDMVRQVGVKRDSSLNPLDPQSTGFILHFMLLLWFWYCFFFFFFMVSIVSKQQQKISMNGTCNKLEMVWQSSKSRPTPLHVESNCLKQLPSFAPCHVCCLFTRVHVSVCAHMCAPTTTFPMVSTSSTPCHAPSRNPTNLPYPLGKTWLTVPCSSSPLIPPDRSHCDSLWVTLGKI